jgi:hypothetical protein
LIAPSRPSRISAFDGLAGHGRRLRDKIHSEICENAYDAEFGAFAWPARQRAASSARLDA